MSGRHDWVNLRFLSRAIAKHKIVLVSVSMD